MKTPVGLAHFRGRDASGKQEQFNPVRLDTPNFCILVLEGRTMNRFGKLGVWILIAATVILPMYELADYTEAWPHDENFVLPAIMLLLIGMALASAKLALDLVLAIAVVSRIVPVFRPRLTPTDISSEEARSVEEDLPLMLCDLRL